MAESSCLGRRCSQLLRCSLAPLPCYGLLTTPRWSYGCRVIAICSICICNTYRTNGNYYYGRMNMYTCYHTSSVSPISYVVLYCLLQAGPIILPIATVLQSLQGRVSHRRSDAIYCLRVCKVCVLLK